ncbi:hypothetical protein BO71DRAFT_427344 [Aspergillus ellipticus CBS 707.79]|uniref:Uncharacterized protein n=1 Tax=Aspergillus ellipticus CBS 707.79 TaxID=1448320 RepID=A0A319E098_9EURO|nr:hypothetical protein BO71DRAFT_427344 [Aspergillus ellipticus CBS 707.79]
MPPSSSGNETGTEAHAPIAHIAHIAPIGGDALSGPGNGTGLHACATVPPSLPYDCRSAGVRAIQRYSEPWLAALDGAGTREIAGGNASGAAGWAFLRLHRGAANQRGSDPGWGLAEELRYAAQLSAVTQTRNPPCSLHSLHSLSSRPAMSADHPGHFARLHPPPSLPFNPALLANSALPWRACHTPPPPGDPG